MSCKLLICVLTLATFTEHVVTKITITSSPQLGVGTVCDNQDVTLMCHTDQTTGNMITWYWSNQSQHGDTITVVARMTGVMYTCVASKDGQQLEKNSIIVVANGTPPHVDSYNFNPYILKYEGTNLTLITTISSDLLLSSGDIKWVGFHRPLPSAAVVDNYTTGGVLYSRLSLYELSFEDDTGNYTNIVRNQCGTSSVSVYIDVRKAPIVCNNSGSVAVPQKNVITVRGEFIKLHCLFKGNLKVLSPSMSSYWMIGPHGQQTEPTYITDNSTDLYRIAVYQTCLSKDGSCCDFTNQLNIQRVPLKLHNTSLTCGEALNEVVNAHAASMMVFDVPTVAKTSDCNTTVYIGDSATLQCQFNAPTMKDITVVVWTKDDMAINSLDHYRIRTFTKPAIEDLIISDLTINSITAADQGRYTCYCYYNRELVISSTAVVSEQQSFRIYCKGKKFPVGYAVVGATSAMLLMSILLVMLVTYRKCRRHLYNRTPAEKVCLMEEEQDTDRTGYYGIVKDGANDANREVASADRLNNSRQMRSVLNHDQFSSNSNDIYATRGRHSSPYSVSKESDSEDDDANKQLLEPLLPKPCTISVSIHSDHPKDSLSRTPDNLEDIETQENSSDGGLDQLVKILVEPQDQKIKVKETNFTIKLYCYAKSSHEHDLKYKWYYLNSSEKPGHFNQRNKAVLGREPLLEVPTKLSMKTERRYCCEVSAAGCRVYSRVAKINLETVWIVNEPKEKVIVVSGKTLELMCKAESSPGVPLDYHWFKCNKQGRGKEPVKFYESKMIVPVATEYYQGHYVCDVSARASSRVVYVEVVNSIEIKITKQPPTSRCIEFNGDLILDCEAKCNHHTVNYQWYHNGNTLSNATSSRLVIKQVKQKDLGSYHCEARSVYSSDIATSNKTQVEWRNTIQESQLKEECGVTDKIALLIGNSNYKGHPLRCPHDDVKALTQKLQEIGFKTISLVDLTLNEMSKAKDYFCDYLDSGMYALFYYSGHGLEFQKTTRLMPIDANEKKIKAEECMNHDVIMQRMQMQKQPPTIISILDCCRKSMDTENAQSLPLIPQSTQHKGAANIFEIYACAPSFEALEMKGSKHSFCTQALLHALDLPGKKLKQDITESITNYYSMSPEMVPIPRIVYQLAHDISLDDPVRSPSANKELLLKLPESVRLYFNHPTMKTTYGHILLDFDAEFSNVLIVHVTCNVTLQPELNVKELDNFGLDSELACSMRKGGTNQVTSYRISNLLRLKDAVQDSRRPAQLQFSFHLPNNSTVKDTIVYDLPSTLINPVF